MFRVEIVEDRYTIMQGDQRMYLCTFGTRDLAVAYMKILEGTQRGLSRRGIEVLRAEYAALRMGQEATLANHRRTG